jgi:hypothetical protein
MNSEDRQSLQTLLEAATHFLRITGVKPEPWCRVMKNPNNGRVGPWQYSADYIVLDQKLWDRPGEVIYFVVDEQRRLRLVGQSMSKLNVRWKRAPMYDVASRQPMGKKALFHTSSWPAIEAGFKAAERPPFTVSAIFRDRLEPLCRAASGGLAKTLLQRETHLQRLSFHVETWVCSLNFETCRLWNKQKVQAQ